MAICTVSGTFKDTKGNAINGATVKFNLGNPALDASGNLLVPKEVSTTTASDGTWSLALVQSISGFLTLNVNPNSTSPTVPYKFSMVIPATTTATFASCWADSANFSGGSSSLPLSFSDISGTLALAQLPALSDAKVWVGNSSSQATEVSISGDISLADTGAVSVATVGTSSAANIHAAELLANAATSSNTASTIVKRDASGNFTAGTITAALLGNATTATTATDFSGSLLGDVTGTQVTTRVAAIQGVQVATTTPLDAQVQVYNGSDFKYHPVSLSSDVSMTNAGVATVESVGGSSAADVHAAELLANAATDANTASAIVKRDSNGDFSAGTITAALSGNATTATSATSATNATNTGITDDTATNATMYLTWVTAGTGNLPQKVSTTKLTFNPSTGTLTATALVGPLTGDVTGNVSGTAATITGVNTVAHGGTGLATLTANNVILGNGTSNVQFVDPGSSGNVLTSNGTTWTSAAVGAGGVTAAIVNINSFYNLG